MKVVNYTKDIKINNLVVTIGAYDGIHQGHRKIFEVLSSFSKTDGNFKTAIITFDIHPDIVLNKTNNDGELNTLKEKIKIFEEYKIDYLIVLNINSDNNILLLDALEFNILLKEMGVKKVIVGEDFRYGVNKSGNTDTLAKDFDVIKVSLVKPNKSDEKISSKFIRQYLENGDLNSLYQYTNEYFTISEKVIEGKKLGSKLGFPTANLPLKFKKMKFGVYYVHVKIDNKIYHGIANVGDNPTTDLNIEPRVEVNIFDFKEDIYDKDITVSFVEYIRSQKKFDNVFALKEQVDKDINYLKTKYKI